MHRQVLLIHPCCLYCISPLLPSFSSVEAPTRGTWGDGKHTELGIGEEGISPLRASASWAAGLGHLRLPALACGIQLLRLTQRARATMGETQRHLCPAQTLVSSSPERRPTWPLLSNLLSAFPPLSAHPQPIPKPCPTCRSPVLFPHHCLAFSGKLGQLPGVPPLPALPLHACVPPPTATSPLLGQAQGKGVGKLGP